MKKHRTLPALLLALLLLASTGCSLSSPKDSAPTAAPTNGKKARVCRIFLSFHSTCGIGIRE